MFGWFSKKIRRSRRIKGVKFIIDGENLLKSLKGLKRGDSDILEVINKAKQYLDKGEEIKGVYFYDTLRPDSRTQTALSKRLKKNNIEVILKSGKVIISGMIKKSRVDPWIIVKITETDERDVRKIFLFSGDSDFEAPLKSVKKRGIKSVVISSHHNISRELKRAADQILYLEELMS